MATKNKGQNSQKPANVEAADAAKLASTPVTLGVVLLLGGVLASGIAWQINMQYTLESKMTEVSDQQNKLGEKFDGLSGSVKELNETTRNVQGSVIGLTSSVNELRARIEAIGRGDK